MPMRCKRAVFHRDRGRCTKCRKDLTGLVTLGNAVHYDHIVPLALGGINDITNIQALCSRCNQKKNDRKVETSRVYEKWY